MECITESVASSMLLFLPRVEGTISTSILHPELPFDALLRRWLPGFEECVHMEVHPGIARSSIHLLAESLFEAGDVCCYVSSARRCGH
jgi:hypothetical protein